MSRFTLLSVVALIGGPILGVNAHNETVERRKIETEGVTVPGIITGGETRSKRRGGKSYDMVVAYKAPGGEMVSKKFNVPKSFAETYVKENELIRDDVQVRCLAADPNQSFVVGAGDGSPELEYIGYGVGAAGLIGTVFTLRRKKAAEQPSVSPA